MPRGIPKAGYRNRGNTSVSPLAFAPAHVPAVSLETDEQINQKLLDRFDVLETLTQAAIAGDARALIVSGPPGLGKSYTVEKALQEWDPEGDLHTIVKGYVKATGLYRLLYRYREEGNVIVFDDADSIFFDDVALNLLKTVCDSTETRRVNYLSEVALVDDDEEVIPRGFQFDGTIIFITNCDFDGMIDSGSKIAPHLAAMVSRAYYIDLQMKTKRDYLIRIKQVVESGMLTQAGLSDYQQMEVMEFIHQNQNNLRELSLRMALKIAHLRKSDHNNWVKLAKITCCKVS